MKLNNVIFGDMNTHTNSFVWGEVKLYVNNLKTSSTVHPKLKQTKSKPICIYVFSFLGPTTWYRGSVLDVLRGKDGHPAAVYEVKYDLEVQPYEVDHLHEDMLNGSVKFIDI
jgi:hypothetical protein